MMHMIKLESNFLSGFRSLTYFTAMRTALQALIAIYPDYTCTVEDF